MIIEKVQNVTINQNEFTICPVVSNKYWENVPLELREALVEEGRKEVEKPWALIHASDYLDFSRTENVLRISILYAGGKSMIWFFIT